MIPNAVLVIFFVSMSSILLVWCSGSQGTDDWTERLWADEAITPTVANAIRSYETWAFQEAEELFGDISDDALWLSWLWYRWKTAMEVWRFSQAVESFTKLTRIEPTDRNYTELWLALYRLWEYAEADSAFTQALTLNQENTRALMNKGVLLADWWALERWLRFLEAANRLDPDNPTILYNMATIYSDLSYEEQISQTAWSALYANKTLSMLDEVLELDPTMSEAYIYKWITLYESGRYDNAITHLEEWLSLDENNISALYYLGNSYKQLWAIAEAQETFDRLLSIDPQNALAIEAKNTLTE